MALEPVLTNLHDSHVEVVTHTAGETQDVGRALGSHAEPGHVYLLFGELGAGKTCLTQGILWGLGGDEFARSPTFVLVSEYTGRIPLYHVDLYRLDSETEVVDLGLDEYLFGDGACAVEWADSMPMMNSVATPEEVRWIVREPATGREDMDIAWRFRVGDIVTIRIENDAGALHAAIDGVLEAVRR